MWVVEEKKNIPRGKEIPYWWWQMKRREIEFSAQSAKSVVRGSLCKVKHAFQFLSKVGQWVNLQKNSKVKCIIDKYRSSNSSKISICLETLILLFSLQIFINQICLLPTKIASSKRGKMPTEVCKKTSCNHKFCLQSFAPFPQTDFCPQKIYTFYISLKYVLLLLGLKKDQGFIAVSKNGRKSKKLYSNLFKYDFFIDTEMNFKRNHVSI